MQVTLKSIPYPFCEPWLNAISRKGTRYRMLSVHRTMVNARWASLHVLATVEAISYAYDVAPVKISESPASNTAIVEHLYNFPHAVPSSICDKKSVY